MPRDHMLGFPGLLALIEPEPSTVTRTPVRPRLTPAEEAARRAMDVPPPGRAPMFIGKNGMRFLIDDDDVIRIDTHGTAERLVGKKAALMQIVRAGRARPAPGVRIPHDGGPCPVPGETAIVAIWQSSAPNRESRGRGCGGVFAGGLLWAVIVAYEVA